uniref:Uncharacterized protein n=1 Tax=Sphaerodactylus townsendi TaxID=933632 RepID=A0ACB8FD04_9SAUR
MKHLDTAPPRFYTIFLEYRSTFEKHGNILRASVGVGRWELSSYTEFVIRQNGKDYHHASRVSHVSSLPHPRSQRGRYVDDNPVVHFFKNIVSPRSYPPMQAKGRGLSFSRFSWVGDEHAFPCSHFVLPRPKWYLTFPALQNPDIHVLTLTLFALFPLIHAWLLSNLFMPVVLLLAFIQKPLEAYSVIKMYFTCAQTKQLHCMKYLPLSFKATYIWVGDGGGNTEIIAKKFSFA